MRKQREIWQQEHTNPSTLLSLADSKPSGAVEFFFKFLQTNDIISGKVIDIGCGKGRNLVYLAKQGFEVWGIDYIQEALDSALKFAYSLNIEKNVHLVKSGIDERWPFEENFFDVAVDCFSSIDIETVEGRAVYLKELKRTLKPGGLALVAVVSDKDEMEKAQAFGLEKNSRIWPNGKFQKNSSRTFFYFV